MTSIHRTTQSPPPRNLGRIQVLLIGALDWPCATRLLARGADRESSLRVDRMNSAREAMRWVRGREIDFIVLECAALGAHARRVVRALRKTFASAGIVIVGELPGAAQVTDFFRSGITDWIEPSAWSDEHALQPRITCEIEKAVAARVALERFTVLEGACRRLTHERRTLQQKLGGACANLADAEENARDREGIAAMQAECRTLLAQESELESVVELSTQYLIARVGPTNAAIFLMDRGQYRLAGYVRDDLARRAAGGLTEHLASAWCERIVAHGEVVRFGPCDPPSARFAELAGVLPGRAVFAFACPNLDPAHGTAIVVLFRDGARPFSPEFTKVARAVGPAFASNLARVRRVLSRAQPQWPRESPDSSSQ